MDDRHKLKEERPPQDTIVSDVKLTTSNVSISMRFFSPVPQDTSKSMRPMGVDDCPGDDSMESVMHRGQIGQI
jgi:hypothetical protein